MPEEEVQCILSSLPESIELQVAKLISGLSKEDAEKLYLIAMPLQDRNLFVAMKQERFAGRDHETIKHVIKSIIFSLMHMHEKGRVLHGDVKPLNIMRKNSMWGMIDLDAAAKIGEDSVGLKSSSAYVPPEGVYVNDERTVATVRSPKSLEAYGDDCELLIASESYDVWSVGCIFYQLVNTKVVPLWQCDQDDNLSNEQPHAGSSVDSLYELHDFTDELKLRKLSIIEDPLARNLAAQMLTKDPTKRPSFSRVLAHPYLSGREVVRLAGDTPKNRFFLSYRVASDSVHVELLFNHLTDRGQTVWWDKKCLEKGKNWEQGFCEGLLDSRAFVCIMSKEAINHPDKDWQNFGNLSESSNCDNVFLEYRLALELKKLGLLDFIFPIFVGNPKGTCLSRMRVH
jgi:serine/threonine protein kinase